MAAPAALISPGMLASLRRTLAARRTETAIVLRPDLVGGVENWVPVVTYPCRRAKDIFPPRLETIMGKPTTVTSVVFGFATDADVQPHDRLQVGGDFYEIQGIDEPNTVADLERHVHTLKKP